MRLYRPGIILFLLFLASREPSVAQTINPHFNFKHLNVQNGLAQNIVYHLLQDSRGYMWMGTRNGLTLYDGVRTINFFHDEQNAKTLASNYINRIIEDSLHRIWIGTDVGISVYNLNDNSFINFNVLTINGKNEKSFCVPMGFVSLYEMWMIETGSKSIKAFDTRTGTTSVVQSTDAVDGVLWKDPVNDHFHVWTYLSTGTIHYAFEGRRLLRQESFFDLKSKTEGENVLQVIHVLPQSDSVVWLSTNEGLVELHPDTRKFSIYKSFKNIQVNECRYAALAPNDSLLWVATGVRGIFTFNIHQKKFADHFENLKLDPSSICSNNIVSVYLDRIGNLWCGSYRYGISYTHIQGNFFQKNLSSNELQDYGGGNDVYWIGYDKNNTLWCLISDQRGLFKLDADKHIKEHVEPVLDGKKYTGTFNKLLFFGRYAWCISNQGLYLYDPSTNRLEKMNYPAFSTELFGSYWIQDIIKLDDGSIAFATFKGLYRIVYSEGKFNIQPFSDVNNEHYTSFSSLFQDDQSNIYLKTNADYFYILQRTKNNAGYAYHKANAIRFLPDVFHYCVDSSGNRVLLSTSNGLYALNRRNLQMTKVKTTFKIPFLSVSGMIKTKDKFWFFGEKGIFFADEKNKNFRNYTTEDGLPANEFNPYAIIFSSSGECIAGTTNGLLSFFTDKKNDISYPPLVQFTNIYINDALSGFVPNPGQIKKISLSHQQNTFSFEFSPITFQHADECSFEYKLDGYDESWIKNGHARYTRYSKIPPGNYVFNLHIIDANGRISPFTKTLDIHIAKAFWQTHLFIILAIAALLTLSWLIMRWQFTRKIRKHAYEFEKQQAVEKERTRIATDMHDDLGAGLSRIKFLSEIIGIKKHQRQPIEEDISMIRKYAHEMIDKMGEIVWALNEKNDSLSDLLGYTRAYAVEYLHENGLASEVTIPEEFSAAFVSGEFRRNIYLTIKEALHNIVKHAQANHVQIKIEAGKSLNISIHDDGIGFDQDNIRPFRNGLSSMQKRMAVIKGTLRIRNEEGTTVLISVPLT